MGFLSYFFGLERIRKEKEKEKKKGMISMK